MTNQLFEAALGIKSPWFVQAVAFDASQRRLTVGVDFAPGADLPSHDARGAPGLRHANQAVASTAHSAMSAISLMGSCG